MKRRTFLANGMAACALNSIAHSPFGQTTATDATLALDTKAERIELPRDFTGLSYESAQLANPGYFSQGNQELVKLVRMLGPHGVLRIGGSTSDYDKWDAVRVPRGASWREPANPDNGQGETVCAGITETSIDELRSFLDATGWTAIYGLNLGHGSSEAAADEAAYVVRKLGRTLTALQVGNEPDLFSRDIRKPSYGYSDYFREWRRFAAAIRERTPEAPLAGPDITDEIGWVEQFAQEAAGVRMLTSHYYAEGPPESPDSDIEHLLRHDADLQSRMDRLVAAANGAHVPYRMSEGNSCYNGGKAGVSDVFASALWGADFMLLLAQSGVAGINFHGGGQGFYTPIAGGGHLPLVPRPLYYGMLFYREFASGSMIRCKLHAGGANATAYACIDRDGRLTVAVINKDLHQDLRVSLQGAALNGSAETLMLQAPGPDSKSGVKLGGREVEHEDWHAAYTRHAPARSIDVPRASAILARFEEASG